MIRVRVRRVMDRVRGLGMRGLRLELNVDKQDSKL